MNKKQSTRLSVYVLSFFHRYGKRPNMEWSIVSKIKHTSNGVSRICLTCNTERAVIAAEDKDLLLNKRQDLSNICPHNRRIYFKWLCLLMHVFISQHFHIQSQTLSLILHVSSILLYAVYIVLYKHFKFKLNFNKHCAA